jgi:hypothetical protein
MVTCGPGHVTLDARQYLRVVSFDEQFESPN